jgi:Na+/melibiose symporter-like transporter
MQTLHGIIATYALGPMLLFAGSILVIWWYPIDRATHARLVSEINDRRMGSGSNPSTLKSQGGVT